MTQRKTKPNAHRPEASNTAVSPPLSRKREFWGGAAIFALAIALCAGLWQLRRVVPFVNDNLHALIAAVFLYLPTALISRTKEEFADYALTHRPLGRGLTVYGIVSLIVFPLFTVGLYAYYREICALALRGTPLPRVYFGMCRRFVSNLGQIDWRWPKDFAQLALAQLVVVALPEEYFFRGYLQTRFERVWPSRRRFCGAPVGWSLLVTSVLFALGHVLVDLNALRLATFFPALAFGWMRQLTGSILAGVFFHASCNLVSEMLHTVLF